MWSLIRFNSDVPQNATLKKQLLINNMLVMELVTLLHEPLS